MRLDKCNVWWKTLPEPEVLAKYTALGVPVVQVEGNKVLGAPVGSDSFRRAFALEHVHDFRPTFANVGLLEDGQVGLCLLRACLGLSRVMNFIRVTPHAPMVDACTKFEQEQRECLTDILRISVPDSFWTLAQKPFSSAVPGLGLTSALQNSPAAFITSWESTADLVPRLVLPKDGIIADTAALPAAKSAYRALLHSSTPTSSTTNPGDARADGASGVPAEHGEESDNVAGGGIAHLEGLVEDIDVQVTC